MSNKASYTPQEWTHLLRSASLAGVAITAASPSGPIGLVKEMFAAGKVLADVKLKGSSNELITALVADLQTSEGRTMARSGLDEEFKGAGPGDIKQRAIAALKEAASIVDAKGTPQEAREFKDWLYEVSLKVAEAAKEGGFLGFGGVTVSEDERAALSDIAAALDVSAPAPVV